MITNYLAQQSTEGYVDLIQSSFSLVITLAIWYKVMDFPAFFKSVRERRERARKKKEKEEFEKMRVLFEAMKNNELEHISLETDESGDEEKKDTKLKIARKKQKPTPPSIV
jgi:hypothetical protein